MNIRELRFDCSALPVLMSDNNLARPLTKLQEIEYEKLKAKKTLTPNQQDKLSKFTKRASGIFRDTELTQGAKTLLKDIYVREKYGKKVINIGKDYSLGLINGSLSEDKSIALVKELYNIPLKVNKDLVKNRLLKGRLDAYVGKSITNATIVIEVKTAQSMQSLLSSLEPDELMKRYYWQLVGYMMLTKAKSSEIFHVVVTYDQSIITEAINRYLYRVKGMDIPKEKVDKEIDSIVNSFTFDDIEPKERVIRITAQRNEADIKRVYARLKTCKKFIKSFEKSHLSFSKKHGVCLY